MKVVRFDCLFWFSSTWIARPLCLWFSLPTLQPSTTGTDWSLCSRVSWSSSVRPMSVGPWRPVRPFFCGPWPRTARRVGRCFVHRTGCFPNFRGPWNEDIALLAGQSKVICLIYVSYGNTKRIPQWTVENIWKHIWKHTKITSVAAWQLGYKKWALLQS